MTWLEGRETVVRTCVLPLMLAGACGGGGLEAFPEPDPCAGVTCSGFGICETVDGAASCVCDEGFVENGLQCLSEDDPCNGVTCSGLGTCQSTEGQATCRCDDGYAARGLECVAADRDPCHGMTCSGHGACQVVGDGTAVCSCDSGYRAEGLDCVEDSSPCLSFDAFDVRHTADGDAITLRWNPLPRAESYEVYQRALPELNAFSVENTGGETTATIRNLPEGGYVFTVEAVLDDDSVMTSHEHLVTIGEAATIPLRLTYSHSRPTWVSLTWNLYEEADTYRVFRVYNGVVEEAMPRPGDEDRRPNGFFSEWLRAYEVFDENFGERDQYFVYFVRAYRDGAVIGKSQEVSAFLPRIQSLQLGQENIATLEKGVHKHYLYADIDPHARYEFSFQDAKNQASGRGFTADVTATLRFGFPWNCYESKDGLRNLSRVYPEPITFRSEDDRSIPEEEKQRSLYIELVTNDAMSSCSGQIGVLVERAD